MQALLQKTAKRSDWCLWIPVHEAKYLTIEQIEVLIATLHETAGLYKACFCAKTFGLEMRLHGENQKRAVQAALTPLRIALQANK